MNLQEQISRIQSMMGVINESMYIDSWGRLHDEDEKILYPFDKISKFVNWFQEEYGDYTTKQGWGIFDSDTEAPNVKYRSERTFGGKVLNGYYWQVQRLDNPDEGEALLGKLKNDYQADELAKKLGLMLDEFGVVIGWQGQLFI